VTGDYKTTPERTCRAFAPVACRTLVTEATFARPDFRWPDPAAVFTELHAWWRDNQSRGRASFVYVYALGKAQRVLAGLDASVGPIAVHPDIEAINVHYRAEGIDLPETRSLRDPRLTSDWGRTLVLLTPSARWKQPCPFAGPYATAFVSGWMLQPGEAEKRRVQRGFVISDHADHAEIHATIAATGAERIGVMHGCIETFVAELQAAGRDAFAMATPAAPTLWKT
jgi:putative mRNA 3-end processing factor